MSPVTVSTDPDLSEFFKYSRPKRPPCKIGHALTQVKGDERRQLEAALAQPNNVITAAAIVTWLEKRNIRVANPTNVWNHRQRKCSCGDDD